MRLYNDGMAQFHFRCIECGEVYREDPTLMVCPVCSGQQERGGTSRGVLEVVLKSLPTSWPHFRASDPEFLHAFLPIGDARDIPSILVGDTPLLEVPRLRREVGMHRLFLKDDTRNPSGSTKDRASLLVVTKAIEYGLETVATASTGNAATALGGGGRCGRPPRSGLRARHIPPGQAHPDAELRRDGGPGGRDLRPGIRPLYPGMRPLRLVQPQYRFNPFTIEGKKTAALEIAVDLSLESPDAVLVPTGDGVILAGLAKGFRDLEAAGLISRRPRLIAVQPEGSSAIAARSAPGKRS